MPTTRSPDAGTGRPAQPAYRERLLPAGWVWASALPVAGSSGLVVLSTLGPGTAVVVAVVAMLLAAWALVRSSAVVQVVDGVLRAGRAGIEVCYLGAVRELDADQVRLLRGRRADARAYVCQRGWVPCGVAVEIDDPDDPAPYWLISSRRPRRLAQAVRAAAAAASPAGPSGQAHSRQTG